MGKSRLYLVGMAGAQQKMFCVLKFAKTNAIVTLQRAFRTEFADRESIGQRVREFKENACLNKGKSSGRARVLEEQFQRIKDALERSPRKFSP